jgi:hypothetical protein
MSTDFYLFYPLKLSICEDKELEFLPLGTFKNVTSVVNLNW